MMDANSEGPEDEGNSFFLNPQRIFNTSFPIITYSFEAVFFVHSKIHTQTYSVHKYNANGADVYLIGCATYTHNEKR